MELAKENVEKFVEALEGSFRRSLIKSLRIGVLWMAASTFLLGLGSWIATLLSGSEFAPIVTALVLGFALTVGFLAFGFDMLSNVLGLGLGIFIAYNSIETGE